MNRKSGMMALVLFAGLLLVPGISCGRTGGVSVSPDSISDPALKRIVSGLEARGIVVTSAAVVTESPLKLSVTATSGAESKGAGFIGPQMEREAAAAFVIDPQLGWIDLTSTDAQGKVLAGRGIPRSGLNFDPDAVPPAKLDRGQAADLIAKSIPPLLPPPLKLSSVDLREDALGARLLYVKVVVPDFERNTTAYQEAFIAVEYKVDDLNHSQGTAVGVQCMQAIDEQGRLLLASWLDFQLSMSANEPGLITDFRPRFFPHPPVGR